MVVAFLRGRDTSATAPRDMVLMNLISSGENDITLPPAAGQPLALAWSGDAKHLYVRTDSGLWQVDAPPGPPHPMPVPAADTAAADSALAIWLGDPPFARAIACSGGGVCIIGPKGDTTAARAARARPDPLGRRFGGLVRARQSAGAFPRPRRAASRRLARHADATAAAGLRGGTAG